MGGDSMKRRSFLQGMAGTAAVAALGAPAARAADFKINSNLLIPPDQAQAWNAFKAAGGPTYAGSAGWKRYTDFLIEKMQQISAVDLQRAEVPYDRHIVDMRG